MNNDELGMILRTHSTIDWLLFTIIINRQSTRLPQYIRLLRTNSIANTGTPYVRIRFNKI